MRVLILSPYPDSIATTVLSFGDEPIARSDRINLDLLGDQKPDFIVSYGYRFIIGEPLLSEFRGRAINLHISYLPWNRGSDPNFWSWIDDTPKGVTIHLLDQGIDTGDILVQEITEFAPTETLASSYEKLRRHVEKLFAEYWPAIRDASVAPRPQVGKGTFHRKQNKLALFEKLALGFATPVADLAGMQRRRG